MITTLRQDCKYVRARGFGLLAICSLWAGALPSAASAQDGYLGGRALHFTLPSAPSDAAVVALELTQIRSAQAGAGAPRSDEAIADANAFQPDALLVRFSDAAMTPLTSASRPMLIRLMTRALGELSHYGDFYKKVAERPRPYAEDPTIKLCFDNPQFPLDPKRSYPSGHAANGYGGALLLAEVFPERRAQILARGLRYGDNRVVCGAHHPSDVLEGQLLAIEYLQEAAAEDRFKRDVACARAENDVLGRKQPALPASCTAPGA